jgi:hypothetical protein
MHRSLLLDRRGTALNQKKHSPACLPLELFQHLVDGSRLVFVLLFGGQLKHRLQGATAAASVPRSMHSTRARHNTANTMHQKQQYSIIQLAEKGLGATAWPAGSLNCLQPVSCRLVFQLLLHMCYFF